MTSRVTGKEPGLMGVLVYFNNSRILDQENLLHLYLPV
jgi:hypothetical protein